MRTNSNKVLLLCIKRQTKTKPCEKMCKWASSHTHTNTHTHTHTHTHTRTFMGVKWCAIRRQNFIQFFCSPERECPENEFKMQIIKNA